MKTYELDSGVPSVNELVAQVKAGEEIVLTDHAQPVAKLVGFAAGVSRPRRQSGFLKGKVWMSPDFDEPLEEFKDYME